MHFLFMSYSFPTHFLFMSYSCPFHFLFFLYSCPSHFPCIYSSCSSPFLFISSSFPIHFLFIFHFFLFNSHSFPIHVLLISLRLSLRNSPKSQKEMLVLFKSLNTFRQCAHSTNSAAFLTASRNTPRLSARCFGYPGLQGPVLRGRISCGAIHAVGTHTVSPLPIVGKRLQRGNATTKENLGLGGWGKKFLIKGP